MANPTCSDFNFHLVLQSNRQAEEIKQSKKYEIIRGLDELKNKIDKLAKLDQDSFKKEQLDILANLNELYQFLDTKPL